MIKSIKKDSEKLAKKASLCSGSTDSESRTQLLIKSCAGFATNVQPKWFD